MTRIADRFSLVIAISVLGTGPAWAHHVMGGTMPATFADGLLSGLGHPVIGLDHLAAVVAVGCLAALHRAGPALAVGFVVAMVAGAALHLGGIGIPAAELLIALTVIGLGALMLRGRQLSTGVVLVLFAGVGLVHGYALGESIYGAEPSPLLAYFIGLAVVQSAVALGALGAARAIARRGAELSALRLIGAGIAGVGVTLLMQQVVSVA